MCKFIVVCLVAKDFFPFFAAENSVSYFLCQFLQLFPELLASFSKALACAYIFGCFYFLAFICYCVYMCAPVSMCGQRTSCRSRFSHLVVWRIKLGLKHGSKHPFLLSLSPALSLSSRVSGVTLRLESIF